MHMPIQIYVQIHPHFYFSIMQVAVHLLLKLFFKTTVNFQRSDSLGSLRGGFVCLKSFLSIKGKYKQGRRDRETRAVKNFLSKLVFGKMESALFWQLVITTASKYDFIVKTWIWTKCMKGNFPCPIPSHIGMNFSA